MWTYQRTEIWPDFPTRQKARFFSCSWCWFVPCPSRPTLWLSWQLYVPKGCGRQVPCFCWIWPSVTFWSAAWSCLWCSKGSSDCDGLMERWVSVFFFTLQCYTEHIKVHLQQIKTVFQTGSLFLLRWMPEILFELPIGRFSSKRQFTAVENLMDIILWPRFCLTGYLFRIFKLNIFRTSGWYHVSYRKFTILKKFSWWVEYMTS